MSRHIFWNTCIYNFLYIHATDSVRERKVCRMKCAHTAATSTCFLFPSVFVFWVNFFLFLTKVHTQFFYSSFCTQTSRLAAYMWHVIEFSFIFWVINTWLKWCDQWRSFVSQPMLTIKQNSENIFTPIKALHGRTSTRSYCCIHYKRHAIIFVHFFSSCAQWQQPIDVNTNECYKNKHLLYPLDNFKWNVAGKG